MPIFTTHKDQLPPHLSYPVGLQTLAVALADVPQAERLSVWFLACDGSVTKAEGHRKDGDYYPIFAAEFHHYRLGISECRSTQSFYEPTWSLSVYGVTRQKRGVAHNLLIEQGIPKIAAWLKVPRSETWLAGKKRIAVSFSDEKEFITATETSAP
jgi:hypothetical protein